jgi:hypothetical protein
LKNLVNSPEHRNIAEKLRKQLDEQLIDEKDPRALGQGSVFDTYKYLGNRGQKGYAEWEKRQKETER